ncbi:hypothetical protein [Haemophilus aegyptius]|uniref:hypothetical protein n=1 Tax=Haemophilus aegyptius TaxID=197575 RepID=UPI000AE7E875|nr:hypothetical protein [Haemophilus aegyptius]STO62007.1 Uncharacterised protein [Haemophilus aegyptius]
MQPIKLGINMNLIHKHYSNDENFYNSNPLQSAVNFGIISLQSKKNDCRASELDLFTIGAEHA